MDMLGNLLFDNTYETSCHTKKNKLTVKMSHMIVEFKSREMQLRITLEVVAKPP